MKNLFILITLIVAASFWTTAQAANKTLLKGELVQEGEQIALYSDLGRVELHTDRSRVQECFDGIFEVVLASKGSAKYKFLKTIICRDKGGIVFDGKNFENRSTGLEDTKGNFCPMVYDPVCALAVVQVCENSECVEREVPKTFGNDCERAVVKAKKLFHGKCEVMNQLNTKGVQTIDTPDVVM